MTTAAGIDPARLPRCTEIAHGKSTLYPDGTFVRCDLPEGHAFPHKAEITGMTIEWGPQGTVSNFAPGT